MACPGSLVRGWTTSPRSERGEPSPRWTSIGYYGRPDTSRPSVSFELEGNLQPGPVGFHFALLDLQIELRDLRDPQIPKRLPRSLDRRGRRLLPGLSAGPDQFDDLVDALRHWVTPSLAGPYRTGSLAVRRPRRRALKYA